MRKIGFLTLLMTISISLFAQPGPPNKMNKEERRAKIKAAKVAFITQQIALTPKEAEKFWPVYNQWDADKKAIRQKNKIDKKMTELSDKEAEVFILNRLAAEEDLVKLDKDYYFRLKEIISPKRILKLQKAEKQFRKKLLRRINQNKKKKRKGGKNRPMNPPGGEYNNH